jgi:AraC-like DNA-binding protein
MNTHLNTIQNWPELLREANWSVSQMAMNVGVSVRTLERHFLKTFVKCIRSWIAEQRQYRAIDLLHKGFTVKETATSLGYQHASNFSRKFPGMRAKVVQTSKTEANRAAMSQNDRRLSQNDCSFGF